MPYRSRREDRPDCDGISKCYLSSFANSVAIEKAGIKKVRSCVLVMMKQDEELKTLLLSELLKAKEQEIRTAKEV